MILQTDEGSDGESDVVALSAGGADLAAFDSGELLETAMILLDRPGEFGEGEPSGFVETLAYQPSNSTARGANPRSFAAASSSAKWSFLVLPSPSLW